MLHEFITCDRCNPDGEIDLDLVGGLDEGTSKQMSGGGDVERARELGWDIVEGDPFEEHICPECQLPEPGEPGFDDPDEIEAA